MAIKYAGKTIIQIAQERGSSAKTKTGAWKYLLNNMPTPCRVSDRALAMDNHSGKYRWDDYREACRTRTGDGRAKILGYDLNDPNTPGRIRSEAWDMNRKWDNDCKINVLRSDYGEIIQREKYPINSRPAPELAAWDAVWALINEAGKKKIIADDYDTVDFDKKGRAEGSALHHELYDMAKNAAIICIRRTEGTRYGVKTLSKTYMLIERKNRKITATELKIPVAKYAKMKILHFGDIIAIARGEKKITLMDARHETRRGYKAVRRAEDGTLVSVWNGSPWEIGKTRIEAARDDHNSGLYYYQDINAMLEAAKTSSIFGESIQHNRLVILEVEASGAHIQYGAKFAATRITPIREIAMTI